MVEIPIPLPKLDEAVSRGKKIADSSTLNWIYRCGMIVACGMIVYFSKGTYETVQRHDTEITHTNDTADILKTDVTAIKNQLGTDHDWITTLKVEVEGPGGILDQLAKLWSRPAPPAENKR